MVPFDTEQSQWRQDPSVESTKRQALGLVGEFDSVSISHIRSISTHDRRHLQFVAFFCMNLDRQHTLLVAGGFWLRMCEGEEVSHRFLY